MLKPFKSLLTYLQKGSPNSSGSYADEKDDVEDASVEGSDALVNDDHDDPLTDPLAFDHDYTSTGMEDEDVNHKEATAAYGHLPGHRDSNDLGATQLEEDDIEEGESGEIVFVDINRLKALPPSPHLLPPPPPVTLPVSSALLFKGLPPADPQFPREDRLRAGVEKPGTSSTAEDADASRSDGSDSGLGSELLNVNPAYEHTLPSGPTSLASPGHELLAVPGLAHSSPQLLQHNQLYGDLLSPPRVASSHLVPPRSALKRASLEEAGEAYVVDSKRLRRTVQFDNVNVFYFARIQGFLCVPSVGGCTLGMESRHMYEKKMTLAEHLAEQRRTHRMRIEQLNPNLTRSQQQLQNQLNNNNQSSQQSSSDDSDEEASSASDVDAELTGFLRPVGTKQRRAMLKSAGVRKIEASEKDECRAIRESREVCGCRCQGYCDPELCYCSINNIKCQVDRPNFPCSCTGECCGNRTGRVEFNPGRVRTHYIHTKMRLELEEKQQRLDGMGEARQQQTKGLMRDTVDYGRPFESSSSYVASEQAMDDLSAFAVPASSSPQSLTALSLPTSPHSGLRVDTEVMLDQDAIAGESSSLAILSRDSLSGDYRCRYESSADYRDDDYRRTMARGGLGEELSSDSGIGASKTNNSGAGSQFCNNILQILGIQSTPPPATTLNATPLSPLIPETKDYSPRRLIGSVEDDNNKELGVLPSPTSYLSLGKPSCVSEVAASTVGMPSLGSGLNETSSQVDAVESGGEVSPLATVIGDRVVDPAAISSSSSSSGSDWPLRNNSNSDDKDAAGHTNVGAN